MLFTALAAFFLAFLSSPAVAQDKAILADNRAGFLVHQGNETTAGSKYDDPAKFRCTSPITAHGGGGCAWSWNMHRALGQVTWGGDQIEMAMLRVEQARDVRGDSTNPKAEFNFLCNDGSGATDAAMKKCLGFSYDHVTAMAPGILADLRSLVGGDARQDSLASPNGRWRLRLQDDGNLVLYDTWKFDDDGNTAPVAVVDLWSLLVALPQPAARPDALK